jgi:(2Fe-2S) ferredoxin
MAKDLNKVQKIVFICNGDSCSTAGANENTLAIRADLQHYLLNDLVHTVRTKCMGQCKQGPIVFLHPEGVWYNRVSLNVSHKIVSQHLLKNSLIRDHLLHVNDCLAGSTKIGLNLSFIKNVFNQWIFKFTGK